MKCKPFTKRSYYSYCKRSQFLSLLTVSCKHAHRSCWNGCNACHLPKSVSAFARSAGILSHKLEGVQLTNGAVWQCQSPHTSGLLWFFTRMFLRTYHVAHLENLALPKHAELTFPRRRCVWVLFMGAVFSRSTVFGTLLWHVDRDISFLIRITCTLKEKRDFFFLQVLFCGWEIARESSYCRPL